MELAIIKRRSKMSENTGGESDVSTPEMWRCIHSECKEEIPPSREGKAPKYCMFCGGSQIRCVNPDCLEPLFSTKTELCHKCGRSQQISVSASHMAAGSDGGNLNNENSETDNGNVASDEKSAKSAPPDKSNTQTEDLKKPIQESQAMQSAPDAGSKAGDNKSPGDSSLTTVLEHGQVANQPKNGAPQVSSVDQSIDKRPPSTMVSESDESSDHEQFHTPPPNPSANESCTDPPDVGDQHPKPSSSISDSLKRMSLESAGRKHSLNREESEDSDESNPAKRKALDSGDPSASHSDKVDGAQIEDKHKKVKQQKNDQNDKDEDPMAADTGKANGATGDDKVKEKKDGKADPQKNQKDEDEDEEDHPLKEVLVHV